MANKKNNSLIDNILKEYKESELIDKNIEKTTLFEADMPPFPDSIYELLPNLIKDYLDCLNDDNERQINLIGYIGLLSGILPNIVGSYDQAYVESNLYVYCVGPFGSGKGQIDKVRKIFSKIHDEMNNEFKRTLKEYKNQMKEDLGSDVEMPVRKFFFIPANNSKSGFIELLNQSDGRGVLLETESDTLADSFKQDYGNFSDDLRKVFHNETVSFYRRGGKELIEINNPHLSVVLAGTYDQLVGIFKKHSNGLLSRFLFYNVKSDPNFKNVFLKAPNHNLRGVISEKSEIVYLLYDKLFKLKKAISFNLNDKQCEIFLEYFKRQKDDLSYPGLTVEAAYVNRWALMTYKIMMILSAIRNFEGNNLKGTLTCSDTDFFIAIKMYETFRDHFFFVRYYLDHIIGNYRKEDNKAIEWCRKLHKDGKSFREIEKITGIDHTTVYRYVKGR